MDIRKISSRIQVVFPGLVDDPHKPLVAGFTVRFFAVDLVKYKVVAIVVADAEKCFNAGDVHKYKYIMRLTRTNERKILDIRHCDRYTYTIPINRQRGHSMQSATAPVSRFTACTGTITACDPFIDARLYVPFDWGPGYGFSKGL